MATPILDISDVRTTIANQSLRYLWEADTEIGFRCRWPQHHSVHPTQKAVSKNQRHCLILSA